MISLKGKKIALVLSGGGAKGAYQIGMLRALEEAGLEKDRLFLAGTSIGALNSLMYAISDTDGMRDMIHALGTAHETGMAFMNALYSDELVEQNSIPITVCAYCVDNERAEHFCLKGLPAQDQKKLTLASASLPDILPPVSYKEHLYLDGGKVPPQCSENAGPADKVPLTAIRGQEPDMVIISYLKPEDKIDHSWLDPSVLCLEIRPSEPLEDEPGTGTRDYSDARLAKNEKMGYEETKHLLALL